MKIFQESSSGEHCTKNKHKVILILINEIQIEKKPLLPPSPPLKNPGLRFKNHEKPIKPVLLSERIE
ncbi:hypothetical protein MSWHS_2985 [Methanosarcina sp. WWM596]|nr:hypothetical protein MSWHS_2985 [Methanosarcina sp. WWM596]